MGNMLRELFKEQKLLLDHFFERIDFPVAHLVFERLLDCKGAIVLSGVGKSGHIAQKISATLASTGTHSFFLSPNHALHGDIGLIREGDVFLFFSKSGESQELIDLIPHIQRKRAFIIGCISDPQSRLANLSHLAMLLPVKKELCPYDLAPTTSTAVQLIFGDCLAIALMRAKGFSQNDFAENHPAGFLGKKITLKVSDLMLKDGEVPCCGPERKLIEVLHELSSKRCGCLLITDEEMRLLGIFTDGDLRRSIEKMGSQALQCKISDLMNRRPKTVERESLAFEAMRQMEADPARPVTVLPVIYNEKIAGLLRMHDILQAGLH